LRSRGKANDSTSPHLQVRCRFITTDAIGALLFARRRYLRSTLGAKFVANNRAVAGLEHKRRRAARDLVILSRDEIVTSRHGNDQMGTLAGRLFTKKTGGGECHFGSVLMMTQKVRIPGRNGFGIPHRRLWSTSRLMEQELDLLLFAAVSVSISSMARQ